MSSLHSLPDPLDMRALSSSNPGVQSDCVTVATTSWWGCWSDSQQPHQHSQLSSSQYGFESNKVPSAPTNKKLRETSLFSRTSIATLYDEGVSSDASEPALISASAGSYLQLFKFREYKDCNRPEGYHYLLRPINSKNKTHILSLSLLISVNSYIIQG